MKVYIGIDGDKVGEKIEALIVAGNLQKVAALSRKVQFAIKKLEDAIISSGGRVIFSGGDSILAEIELDEQQCDNLVRMFHDITGCTASAGIGNTPIEAYLALKLAKGSDSEKVIVFRSGSK